MQTMKSTFGLVRAFLPVLFCGGFLLYFGRIWSASGGALDSELGPTVLGIGAFGLLFLVLFLLKVLKLFGGRGRPGAGAGSGGGADEAPQEEQSDFDPDAALARYMARRAAGGPGGQKGFGRKGA